MIGDDFDLDQQMGDGPGGTGFDVQMAEFAPVGVGVTGDPSGIELLMDVELKLNVELGKSSLSIKDILALGPGSVMELDKMASEPVDVFINGTQIARGEVVVVDEKFGVRVTEIVTPAKRIKSLG